MKSNTQSYFCSLGFNAYSIFISFIVFLKIMIGIMDKIIKCYKIVLNSTIKFDGGLKLSLFY